MQAPLDQKNELSSTVTDVTTGKAKKKKKPVSTTNIDGETNLTKKIETTDKKLTRTNTDFIERPIEKSFITPFVDSNANDSQKKRSEFKLKNFSSNNNNNSKGETFSSFNETDSRVLPKHPPGFSTQPPPGFAPKSSTTFTQAPPGFLDSASGFTFTSSFGETYNIVSNEDKNSYGSYISPPNFQRRNKNLVAQLNGCFDRAQESNELKTFKFLSSLYRAGNCTAEEYYEKCKAALGNFAFQEVFPELLALLPDIKKQRELYAVHQRNQKKFVGRIDWLESCNTCGQVLRGEDLKDHANAHTLESHFPVLVSTATNVNLCGSSNISTAWSKTLR